MPQLSYSIKAPDPAIRIPAAQQASRVVLSLDQCVIDNSRYFLRGRILIPIHTLPDPFIYGLWAELSARDFYRTQQLWQTHGREATPPIPAFLATELPHYPRTTNLPIEIHTQPVGSRPQFKLLAPDHSLAHEQRNGISLDRARQIAEALLPSATT